MTCVLLLSLDTDLNGGNYGGMYFTRLGKLYTMREFWGGARGWTGFIIIHSGWYKSARGQTLKDPGPSRS